MATTKRSLIKTCTAALCLPVLIACAPQSEQEATLGVLYCAEGNPESFNPQLVTSGTTLDMTAAQLYDRLIEYSHKENNYQPALAERWSIDEHGLRYTFYLRDDVQFHTTDWFQPSRPLNANDVVFSFRRWFDPSHPFHSVSGRGYPFFTASGITELIDSMKALDEHTVEIRLKQQDSSFLANLASDFAIILSAEYGHQLLAAGTPELIDQRPIGTGPFQFSDFRKDVLVRYHRHPNYWRELAASEQIVFRITQSDHKRMLMLLTQDCDISPYPPARDVEWLRQKESIELQATVSPNTAFWAFNTERPPFDDPRVRQALAHAIDRDALLRAVYFEHAVRADSILPNTSWAHHPIPDAYRFDPERARELLAEADLADGFSMDIWAIPVQRGYNPNARLMAERMQSDLARIGVRANIVSYEWSTFRRRLAEGLHDSVLIGWSADHADPDNFFRPLLSCRAKESGNNRAQWCDPLFDDLLNAAIRTELMPTRQNFYQQAQEYLAIEVPLLPIAHSVRFQASQADIEGLQLAPFGGIELRRVKHRDTQELRP
ncbi:ABC transporter substrate-binding protein [Aliidiomarina haloalkalitolerans]|uniref:ABC transporter substrate-binding protein n=1 Tax=Aliidiomarina haloalkalitolerans TaxID=859059 RepID=A0A432VY20_9GAMM|nr:ABC transporter substrate-binding protein [Aliidiomarina haloalkalitolerans]RUO21574.1 ABC transporter substrate-binding protein [Aliidiomarina haloalkalitolerans]